MPFILPTDGYDYQMDLDIVRNVQHYNTVKEYTNMVKLVLSYVDPILSIMTIDTLTQWQSKMMYDFLSALLYAALETNQKYNDDENRLNAIVQTLFSTTTHQFLMFRALSVASVDLLQSQPLLHSALHGCKPLVH